MESNMRRFAHLLMLTLAVASTTALLAGCGGDGSNVKTSTSEPITTAGLIEGATPAEEALFDGRHDVAVLHDKDGDDAGYINLSNDIFWVKNVGFGQVDSEQKLLWGPATRIPSDLLAKAEASDPPTAARSARHPRSQLERACTSYSLTLDIDGVEITFTYTVCHS
jgi:hypothetical protein